jgi:hypothetical protein
MDATRFDALARSLAGIRSRRSALQGFLLGTGGLLSLTAAQDAAAKNCKKIKNKKRRKKCLANQAPPRCVSQLQCGEGCCEADSCFAESVNADNGEPLSFACCPAEKLCRSTDPLRKDQCCYPDETCDPTLGDNPLSQTICCRPCNGKCCLNLNEECINDVCTPINTARLARTRRPG